MNDGSTLSGLQVVLNPECEGYSLIEDGQVATGASVAVVGELTESPGGRQKARPLPGPSRHMPFHAGYVWELQSWTFNLRPATWRRGRAQSCQIAPVRRIAMLPFSHVTRPEECLLS